MDQSHGEGIQFIAFEQDLGTCCITSKTQNSEMQWVYKMKFGSNGTIPRYKARPSSKRIHTKNRHQLLKNLFSCCLL